MLRRSKRHNSSSKNGGFTDDSRTRTIAIAAGIIAAVIVMLVLYWPLVVIVGFIVAFAVLVKLLALDFGRRTVRRKRVFFDDFPPSWNDEGDTEDYSIGGIMYSKKQFLSNCEKKYLTAILSVVKDKYIVQGQINLASVIDKPKAKYRNELFRNVDFGIFDLDYNLELLIEINDSTHYRYDRRKRDNTVQTICFDAGIPLITFWTMDGINEQMIKDALSEHLTELSYSQSCEKDN